MAETGNENGASNEDRGRTPGEPPSYAHTDPEWVTGDFSSLDLGEDPVDTSARPVRRLDLPPLVQTGEEQRPPGATPPIDGGVFASVPDDENLTVSPSAAAVDRTAVQPVRGEGSQPGGFGPSASEPKQGTPPHPHTAARRAGAGSVPGRGEQDRYRQGMGGQSSPGGDHGDYTTVFEDDRNSYDDRFGVVDRRQPVPMGGHRPGAPGGQAPRQPGRAQLELAPALQVEQARSRWMVPLAALLGVLALAAGYWVFVRSNDDSATFAADSDDLAADLVEDDLEGDPAADAGTSGSNDPSAPAVLSDSPVLTLDGAADGPLQVETQYEMTLEGVPNDSEYLVVVDDIPQEPALDYLPVLILPEGRHTIFVTVTSGGRTADTNSVEVYVLAPELTATHRANLSSVSVADQGWAEALRQFDEFRAAGHENLMLSPSDPYPSLLPGFWNIYVAGFADGAAATAYCEQFELAIPNECFPAPFDPDGPPRDS